MNQSRWDSGLRGLSWRVDGKSQSRHSAEIHTPVAIMELEIGKSGQVSSTSISLCKLYFPLHVSHTFRLVLCSTYFAKIRRRIGKDPVSQNPFAEMESSEYLDAPNCEQSGNQPQGPGSQLRRTKWINKVIAQKSWPLLYFGWISKFLAFGQNPQGSDLDRLNKDQELRLNNTEQNCLTQSSLQAVRYRRRCILITVMHCS